MLHDIEQFARAGFAIHWLHSKSKRPIGDKWSEAPVKTLEQLRKSYRDGNNVGVRLGKWSKVGSDYLLVIDVDIRKPELAKEAFAELGRLIPQYVTYPSVVSGSGGASRHFYILTSREFPSKQLAHSENKSQVWDESRQKNVDKWDWEIELFGTGKQVAMPPSIHPITEKPYVWERSFDLDDLDLGMGPFLDADYIAKLIEYDEERENGPVDPEAIEPLGLTPDEVREMLAKIPNVDLDYEEWLNVMASVQHEAQGHPLSIRKQFYEVFRSWSALSDKHDDETTLFKYKSFKNSPKRKQRTMRSIQHDVKELEFERIVENLDDDIDDLGPEEPEDNGNFDDVLGGTDQPAKVKAAAKKQKWESSDAPEWVRKMNKKHALIIVGGKSHIMRFTAAKNGEEDHELWDTKTFHEWYLAQPTVEITIPGKKDKDGKPKIEHVTLSKAFLSNQYRRGYEQGYVFDTTSTNNKGYNLFRGWGVEPKAGSCERILDHIRLVLCRGNLEAYEFFLDYYAHMFQRPWEIPRSAIVVKGEEGAGKDTWAKYLMKIISRYSPKITGQDQFFSNYNGFLKNALFVNLQEAFVGSQQQNEKLKQYITEDEIKVESKYQNAYDTPNYMRLYITSNNFRVVHASESARRFLVLNSSDEYVSTGDPVRDRRNQRYFDALYDEMNGNGPAAILNYLLTRELKNFPRIPPATEELSAQVATTWKGVKRFMYYAASYGDLDLANPDEESVMRETWIKGNLVVNKALFRQCFNAWAKTQKQWNLDEVELTPAATLKLLQTMVGAQATKRRLEGGSPAHCYVFPNLSITRERISTYAKGKLVWGDEIEVAEIAAEPDEEDDL